MAFSKMIKSKEQLLVEYRARLISDVVTGKLDARDIVAPEFEAVENIAGETDYTEEAEAANE